MTTKKDFSNTEKLINDKGSEIERIYSFDLIRIIAIFSVVMIHSSAPWVAGEDIVIDSFAFNIGNFFDSISRIGVPLFCMLSGALLLNEEKNFSFAKMRKSILNIGTILILWNIFYTLVYVMKNIINGEPLSIRSIIIGIVNGHFHLWYLYMLIGFYLIIPFIKPLIRKDNWKNILYFVFIAIFVQMIIPLIDFGFSFFTDKKLATLLIDKFHLDFFKGFTVYFLTGWLITNIPLNKRKRYLMYCLGIIGTIITVVLTRFLSIKKCIFVDDFYSNHSINVFMYSVGVFVFIYYTFKNIKPLNRFLLNLSKLSFGVYLIHPFIQSVFRKLFSINNALPAICLEWTFVVVISYVIVYVMSKIPIIKKLVRV